MHEMLRSFLNLGASPRTREGGGRHRQDHPQPPLPSSQPAGPWCDAGGTGTCLSLLRAPEPKGLRPRLLHGNEHRSLRRVGKLMLSQGRVRLSAEVRSSPLQPAPQPLPGALRQLCGMEVPAEAGWEPPGPLQQTGPMPVTPRRESAASACSWILQPQRQRWGRRRVHLSPPDTGVFPRARARAGGVLLLCLGYGTARPSSPSPRVSWLQAGLAAAGLPKPWDIVAWPSWEPAWARELRPQTAPHPCMGRGSEASTNSGKIPRARERRLM